jgi:hypothetical protein
MYINIKTSKMHGLEVPRLRSTADGLGREFDADVKTPAQGHKRERPGAGYGAGYALVNTWPTWQPAAPPPVPSSHC